MEIPAAVSGRRVTPRGVHFQPSDYHGGWCSSSAPWPRAYWLDLLQAMGISWAVLLYSGRSALELFDGKEVVRWLLDAGVIPVLRYHTTLLPRSFQGADIVRELADIYADYGLKPPVQLWNEPGNPREWVDSDVPAGWWGTFVNLWISAAQQVVAAGGWPGFPDGPDYNYTERHPFRDTPRWLWVNGHAWFGVHPYGLGRPLAYPTDAVSRLGTPITEAEYCAALDDLAGRPEWWDPPVAEMNALRQDPNWRNPDPVLWDGQRSNYTACWWSWRLVDYQARDVLGQAVPLIATEGGWTPKARAGTGPGGQDRRWPLDTPKGIGRKTLAAFEEVAATPCFLAACPWILATEDMGGSGWPDDCWHGWAFSDIIDQDTGEPYGRLKPVGRMLQAPPGGVGAAIDRIVTAQGRLDGAMAALQ